MKRKFLLTGFPRLQKRQKIIQIIREERKIAINWRNYLFHLVGDSNREINIAVLVYHIPKLN